MDRAFGLLVAIAVFACGTAIAQDKAPSIASQVCAACHAADGNSTAPANPKIAAQIADYLHKQLRDFKAQDGKKPLRESPVMNGMVANLSEADMKGLAGFFAGQSLKPAAAADKDLAATGQKLWRGGDAANGVPACAGCHGPAGGGIPAQYPRLAGQYAEYLVTQLTAFREGKRVNDPNGMMRGVAARMSDGQIRAVAEYAAGLR
jgi:cytochrome c553